MRYLLKFWITIQNDHMDLMRVQSATKTGTQLLLRWNATALKAFIVSSLKVLRARKKLIGHTSPWWSFIYQWPKEEAKLIISFINGSYRFEPVNTYVMRDETITVWSYTDRLFVRALLFLIKPVFKHIISANCLHLKGPSGVKNALNLIKKAFDNGSFRYFMRVDIKGYYASIDRKILREQTMEYFKDPRVLDYLDQIINIPTLKDGAIYIPRQGIHRRSSLSPFLGALYLSPLDKAFENSQGIWYIRYMDDILILTNTKKQFCKAKRRLQQVLSQLRLQVSKRKTKMGPLLTKGFHFLGVHFKVNVEPSHQKAFVKDAEAQTQCSQSHVNITLHERCCVRAMDRITVMEEDIVHPMKVQRYLSRWATWWHRTVPEIKRSTCLTRWVQRAEVKKPKLAWLGVSLLRPLLSGRASPTSAC